MDKAIENRSRAADLPVHNNREVLISAKNNVQQDHILKTDTDGVLTSTIILSSQFFSVFLMFHVRRPRRTKEDDTKSESPVRDENRVYHTVHGAQCKGKMWRKP